MDIDPRFDGIAKLYGDKEYETLVNSHVLVVGIGGVGTWICEALARSAVGNITVVDMDDICISNTNRQLVATDSTYGKMKVDIMKERILSINPKCNVHVIHDYFTEKTKDLILDRKYDYVVDCIDSIKNKCILVNECLKKEYPVITIGGGGGKNDATQIQISDLNNSKNDRLLTQMRNALKKYYGFHRDKRIPYGVACVYSPEVPSIAIDHNSPACDTQDQKKQNNQKMNCTTGYGSATFITGTYAFLATGYIVNQLTNTAPNE